MFHPSTTKNHHLHKPVAKLVQLETYLIDGGADSFYTGFSGKIEDGGIFITTWRFLDMYTPVEVTIHFPGGQTIRPRGAVEWIRETNPDISDTLPGIGISFFDLKQFEHDLIDTWLLTHPPVFLDNVEIEPPPRTAPAPDDIEIETLPVNLGPECDLNDEALFVNGLARDITHYLNERPMTVLRKSIAEKKRSLAAGNDETLLLRVLPSPRHQRFQGGFQANDPEYRLFVVTDTPAAIGSQLNLELICETGVKVGFSGEVRWIRKQNPLVNHFNAPAGMGIVLRKIKRSTWQAINPDQAEMLHCEKIR